MASIVKNSPTALLPNVAVICRLSSTPLTCTCLLPNTRHNIREFDLNLWQDPVEYCYPEWLFLLLFESKLFFSEKLDRRLYFTSRRSLFSPIQSFQNSSCPALCEFNNTTEFFKHFRVICSYHTISSVYKLLSIDDATIYKST